jgi:hypothetical protein
MLMAFAREPASFLTVNIKTEFVKDFVSASTFERTAKRVVFSPLLFIFDSRTLSEKFPYLQDFFTSINNWRAQTGRVTIDDNVLNESTKRTLCKRKSL